MEPLDRFSRFIAQMTCFRARRCLFGVRRIDYVTWGKYAAKPHKVGTIKTAYYVHGLEVMKLIFDVLYVSLDDEPYTPS